MRSIVIGLTLAATVAAAGDLGAQVQRGRPDVYGQSGGTVRSRTATARREYALADYLDGISLSVLQKLRVDRVWASGAALDQRLYDVRALLTSTQQRRFDSNVAQLDALSQQGGYGNAGSSRQGDGRWEDRARDRVGDRDGDRDDDRGRDSRGRGEAKGKDKAHDHDGRSAGVRQDAQHRRSSRG